MILCMNEKFTIGFKKFQSGDYDLTNKERDRPKTKLDNKTLKELVEVCLSLTTRELGELVINAMTVFSRLKELGKTKKLEIRVPS